jgi:hypothetical protein
MKLGMKKPCNLRKADKKLSGSSGKQENSNSDDEMTRSSRNSNSQLPLRSKNDDSRLPHRSRLSRLKNHDQKLSHKLGNDGPNRRTSFKNDHRKLPSSSETDDSQLSTISETDDAGGRSGSENDHRELPSRSETDDSQLPPRLENDDPKRQSGSENGARIENGDSRLSTGSGNDRDTLSDESGGDTAKPRVVVPPNPPDRHSVPRSNPRVSDPADRELAIRRKFNQSFMRNILHAIRPVVPELVRLEPTICPSVDCVVNATFNHTDESSEIGYCRFGDAVVQADTITNDMMQCHVPPTLSGRVLVSIGFDRLHFSVTNLVLVTERRRRMGKSAVFIIAVIVGLAAGGVLSLRMRRRKFVERNDDHEKLMGSARLDPSLL